MSEERFDYAVDDATRFVDNLKDRVHDLYDKNEELKEEMQRLSNIINEFDKWLDEESEKTILSTGHLTCLMMCKNKLQELKGSDKE